VCVDKPDLLAAGTASGLRHLTAATQTPDRRPSQDRLTADRQTNGCPIETEDDDCAREDVEAAPRLECF